MRNYLNRSPLVKKKKNTAMQSNALSVISPGKLRHCSVFQKKKTAYILHIWLGASGASDSNGVVCHRDPISNLSKPSSLEQNFPTNLDSPFSMFSGLALTLETI